MEITKKDIDSLNAVLTVAVKEEDYSGKVQKILTDYRKTANIPGFRKGHVPMGMVKKQYGKAVLVEEVNKILQEEGIGFFVYGTLSLGQKEIDQSTGNNLTKASISGTVFDLTSKRAKRISSIAPQVVSGLGTTQDESRRLAIANSAKQSADILINVLNKRGTN